MRILSCWAAIIDGASFRNGYTSTLENCSPGLMSVFSTLLMLLAAKQQPMLWQMGTGWETPSTVINSLINGPAIL
jgi:hypothetical protein